MIRTTHTRNLARPRRWLLAALLLCTLVGFVLPPAAHSQDTGASTSVAWQEQRTTHFVLLYEASDQDIAAAYAGFVDQIYEDVSAQFAHRTATPLNLRLYPTFESYYEVNPAARDLPGIVAHADSRRREVAVVLPQTELQSPDDIQNNIRHELAHIVASDLSNNGLNTGFHEGIAQYVETPTEVYTQKLSLVGRAYNEGRLMDWSDFENRDGIYGDPELAYPQTLAVVTFLIETYSFERFREFIVATGETNGYRSALQRTYNLSPSDLEAQWLAWLPSFIDGSYRDQPAASYDLTHPRALLEQGRYAEAQTELERTIAWLSQTPQDDLLSEAQTMLERSQQGQQANAIAVQARSALQTGDYTEAQAFLAQARDAYAAVGDTRQNQVLAVYEARIERGLSANRQLAEAADLAGTLRFPQARAQADAAAAEFAALGDTARLDEAVSLRESLDGIQSLAGTALLTLGLLGVLVSLWGRWFSRDQEVW